VCIDEFPDDSGAKFDIRKSHTSPLRCVAAKVFSKFSRNAEIATYRALHERMIARSLDAHRG
jgi:hypothetical protein